MAPLCTTLSGKAVACAFLAAVAAGCGDGRSSEEGSRLLADLAALGPFERTSAARLTVPVHHRSCAVETTQGGADAAMGCDGGAATPDERLLALSAETSRFTRESDDGEPFHVAGLIDLLWSDSTGNAIDRAISFLETSALLSSDGRALADLSAAHLTRHERQGDLRDLLSAVEAAMRSIEVDSIAGTATRERSTRDSRSIAYFNLALGLSRLRLHGQASEAWSRAVVLEQARHWRDEILLRANADSVIAYPVEQRPSGMTWSTALVRRAEADHQWGRTFGWDSLLPAWGAAVEGGDLTRAGAVLAVAESLGTLLVRRGGDSSLAQAARAARSSADHMLLAGAHVAFGRGRRSYESAMYDSAIGHFARARAGSETSPALRTWAQLWKGIALAQSGHPDRGAADLHQVARTEENRQSAARARAQWALATSYMRTSRAEESVAMLREAGAIFRALGEQHNAGTAKHLETVAQVTLGDRQRVFHALDEALGSLRYSRGSVRLHNALYLLAELAQQSGFPRAALAVQREGLLVARVTTDLLNISEALIAVARLEQHVRGASAASTTLEDAEATLNRAAEGVGKRWVGADLLLAAAEIREGRSSREAIGRLDEALAFFQEVALPLRTAPALVVRADRLTAVGDTAAAIRDLERVLGMVEAGLRTTRTNEFRISLAQSIQSAVDRLARLRLAAGFPDDALAIVENGRSLLDATGRMDPAGARRRDGVVLDYAFLSDSLHVWVVDGSGIRWKGLPVTRDALHTRMVALRSLMELRHDAAVVRELGTLHELLVAPIASLLPDSGRVTIIGDGEIGAIPFAALFDRERDEYVIERFAIQSAGTLIPRRMPSRVRRTGHQLLIVADPAFDRGAYPALMPLPGARIEADSIAALYGAAARLTGDEATWPRIRGKAAGATVFHFGGHVLFDPSDPAGTRLLLAESPGALLASADSIATLDFRRMQLVVLSSCESGRTYGGRIGGLRGLASAFHRAGAESVVGSLWRVDDDRTAPLMLGLHRSYRSTGEAAAALRTAILGLLRSNDAELRSPASWAAFQVIAP